MTMFSSSLSSSAAGPAPRRRRTGLCRGICALLLVGFLAACAPVPRPSPTGPVVVFLLDAPVNRRFLEGRVAGLRSADITHGSLVGRVLVSYCDARVIALPVQSEDGSLDRRAYLDGLRTVLAHAREHPDHMVIVNLSLSASYSDREEAGLIERLQGEGALIVAAAGNDNSAHPHYPAAYPGVVAVASATPSGKALHSNYGPHVDIAASGDITFIDYEFLPYERLHREMESRGTSFATPRVAGTLAFILQRSPELSPREAFEMLLQTARPIEGPHFRDGLLGAGLLDVHRARSRVAPGYRFANFLLPVAAWVILGVFSVYLCLRRGAVGLFLTLMLWLVVLPASYVVVVEFGRWLHYAGGGSLVVGLGVAGVMCAAAVVAAALQDWQPLKGVLATIAACVLFLVAMGTWPGRRVGPVYLAPPAGLAAIALALAWERRTRGRLLAVSQGAAPGERPAEQDLIRTGRRTLDRRLRRAALEALGRRGGADAVEYLLGEKRCPEVVAQALAGIADRAPEDLRRGVGSIWRLTPEERDRLLAALRQAHNPALVPWLEQAARRRPDDRLIETLEALRAGQSEEDD